MCGEASCGECFSTLLRLRSDASGRRATANSASCPHVATPWCSFFSCPEARSSPFFPFHPHLQKLNSLSHFMASLADKNGVKPNGDPEFIEAADLKHTLIEDTLISAQGEDHVRPLHTTSALNGTSSIYFTRSTDIAGTCVSSCVELTENKLFLSLITFDLALCRPVFQASSVSQLSKARLNTS